MADAPDRPTREQVDADLATVEGWSGLRRYPDVMVATETAIGLGREVRALRAELDEQGNELSVRRLQDLVAARTPPPAGPTPEAYTAASRALDVWHTRRHEALRLLRDYATAKALRTVDVWVEQIVGVLDAPVPSLPAVPDGEARKADADLDGRPLQPVTEALLVLAGEQLLRAVARHDHPARQAIADVADWLRGKLGDPGSSWPVRAALSAVPDGEPDETGRCDWCGSEVPLTSDGYMHGHKQPEDGADCAGSHDTAFGHLAAATTDGEDAPARLGSALLAMCDEAEAVVENALTATGTREVPVLDVADVRAAVAAALALPAEPQK